MELPVVTRREAEQEAGRRNVARRDRAGYWLAVMNDGRWVIRFAARVT